MTASQEFAIMAGMIPNAMSAAGRQLRDIDNPLLAVCSWVVQLAGQAVCVGNALVTEALVRS